MVDEWLDDLVSDAFIQLRLNSINDGLRIHLCSDVLYERLRFGGRFVARGYCLMAKLVCCFGVACNARVSPVDGLSEQIDLVPQFAQIGAGALIGFDDRCGMRSA